MSELRQNLLTGDWVVLAAGRSMRPESFTSEPKPEVGERLSGCPFCAGNESETPPEVFALRPPESRTDGPGWEVRVVPNKYPALSEQPGVARHEPPYLSMPASGRHEVIIHGPGHNATLAHMSVADVAKVFSVYRERLKDLEKDPSLVSAIIIINQGREAGASIEHPHSQLFALPIVSPSIEKELVRIKETRAKGGRCPVCSMLAHEADHKERLIAENDHFLAFCPYASRLPFEISIMPKAHRPGFAAAGAAELAAAAEIVKFALERLRDRLKDPPYNLYLHTVPFHENGDYHWHMTILPKLTTAAGFELGTGIMINIADPDSAARFLR